MSTVWLWLSYWLKTWKLSIFKSWSHIWNSTQTQPAIHKVQSLQNTPYGICKLFWWCWLVQGTLSGCGVQSLLMRMSNVAVKKKWGAMLRSCDVKWILRRCQMGLPSSQRPFSVKTYQLWCISLNISDRSSFCQWRANNLATVFANHCDFQQQVVVNKR